MIAVAMPKPNSKPQQTVFTLQSVQSKKNMPLRVRRIMNFRVECAILL
jgi:hypothetical protein